jgi:predicted nuclease of predicted toxin-antitoxin system
MKLLLDQGVPRSSAELLRKEGVDVIHIGEIGHCCSDDIVILELARDQGRTIVTLDADFHTLLALSGEVTPSVIFIRREGLRGEAMAKFLLEILATCFNDLVKGASVTAQINRIRIRHLPIIQKN